MITDYKHTLLQINITVLFIKRRFKLNDILIDNLRKNPFVLLTLFLNIIIKFLDSLKNKIHYTSRYLSVSL